MVSTAKEGFFKKQSVVFLDCTGGEKQRPLAKLLYNDSLASSTRLELHDVIARTLDQAGMAGEPLIQALRSLFAGLEKERISAGATIGEDIV